MPQTTGPTKLTDYILTSITWGVVKRSNNKFAFQFVKVYKRSMYILFIVKFLHLHNEYHILFKINISTCMDYVETNGNGNRKGPSPSFPSVEDPGKS